MIIVGNKITITTQENKPLSSKIEKLHYIDISHSVDDKIISEIKNELDTKKVKYLVLNLEKDLSMKLKSYLEELDYDGTKILIFAEFSEQFLDRKYVEFNEKNIEVYNSIHEDNPKKIGKSVFDFFFSIFSLILLAPIMIVIAFMIKLKSPDGKILFTQQRLGRNGKFFSLLKFRTMVPNAEQKLKEMLDSDEKVTFLNLKYRKLQNDPRVIPSIGDFLRKTSLDELAQIFNVLKCEMNFVGPRPYIEDEFYSHDDKFLDVILSIKPGVTGPWQVGQRNNTTFNQRVLEDVKYI